ncbi:MAG: hypothetical protein ACXWUG_19660 [Polyangiales bacterium]
MAGFQFRETMSGSFHLVSSPTRERAMSFTIGAYVASTFRFLRDRTAQIQGEVDLEGFARHRPLRGHMEIDPILGRRIVYDFQFPDDDGAMCRFYGQKSVDLLHIQHSMTTLPGEIRDASGRTIGEARVRFDIRSDLAKFVMSWKRLALAV